MRIPILILALSLTRGAFAVGAATAGERLFDHVNGYTLDGAGQLRRFEAMLVADGRIAATGSRAALARKAPSAEVIDGG